MPGYESFIRSLTQSTDTPVKAHVKGTIPDWVDGTLYRNGPGRFQFGEKIHQHLFDGQAVVHKLRIQKGQVFYSNRLLETVSLKQTLETGRLTPNFGSVDVESNIFGRFKTSFIGPKERNDNVNVNVAPFANEQLYALTETNLMCRLEPKDLGIMETVNVSNYVPGLRGTFAHPHVEKDGTWLTMGIAPRGSDGPTAYKFLRYKGGEAGAQSKNACEQVEVICSLPSSYSYGFSYFHSFGLTQKYIVFLEQSVILSYKDLVMGIIKNEPLSSALQTYKDLKCRIHVIDKQTGERINKNFVTDPQFTFHYINSYEHGDEIVVDLSSYDTDYFTVKSYSYENSYSDKLLGSKEIFPIARRVRIPLKSTEDKEEIHCEIKDLNPQLPFEFPIINYARHNGLHYKYVYGANHYKLPFSVVKLNVDNPSEVCEFTYEDNGRKELPSEPIFFENPNAKSEDDGVLLVLVLSEKNDYLSVLDAKDLKEIARAELPEGVKSAFTFHGFFADSTTFEKLNV